MSVAEEVVRPIFGEITLEQMAGNEALARTVMAVVKEACKHSKGRYTVESVAQGLADGVMHVWGVLRPPDKLDAAVVLKRGGDVCEIIIAGPEFDDVAPFVPVLMRAAQKTGCERMRIMGPQFFRPKLPSGWFAREVVYECLLDGSS